MLEPYVVYSEKGEICRFLYLDLVVLGIEADQLNYKNSHLLSWMLKINPWATPTGNFFFSGILAIS